MQTSQVFNQKEWPQAGDADDCWVVSTIWCANAVAPWLYLPNTTQFRAAAGDPDDGKTDGGRLSEIMQACKALYPKLGVQAHRGSWAALEALLDAGHPASVAVDSGNLPPRHAYGFTGLHQIALFVDSTGTLKIMNPLDKDRGRTDVIGREAAKTAAKAYGAGTQFATYAAVFPTEAEAFKTHPLWVAPPPPIDCEKELAEAKATIMSLDRRLGTANQRIHDAAVDLGTLPPAPI